MGRAGVEGTRAINEPDRIVLPPTPLGEHAEWVLSLLSFTAARLQRNGLTHLAVYTAAPTPGWGVLSSLTDARDEFHMWTRPWRLAPDADQRGAYVDAPAF